MEAAYAIIFARVTYSSSDTFQPPALNDLEKTETRYAERSVGDDAFMHPDAALKPVEAWFDGHDTSSIPGPCSIRISCLEARVNLEWV